MKKIAFIDRDGTLIEEPEDFQVDSLAKLKLLADVIPSLLRLKQQNFQLVMITNQDGLGTSSFPTDDFNKSHDFMLEIFKSQGIEFDDILICPHFESDNCNCRKPKLGLVQKYLNQFDAKNSFVVGDRPSDEGLAANMGIQCYRVDQIRWKEILTDVLDKPSEAIIKHKTKETNITGSVKLDNLGTYDISTGLPFFDHMLEQLSKHSGVSMTIKCTGDLAVDDHHTIEDVAIALGQALSQALSDRIGLTRYGFLLPMDETLVSAAIDLSGRAFCKFEGQFNREQINGLATEMIPHFFLSLSHSLKATLHIKVEGENTHHMIEACFKAVAKCLKQALEKSGTQLMSTKGSL